MDKLLKILIALAVVGITAGCGSGGPEAGASPFVPGSASSPTGTAVAADLIVTSSAAQLPNTGSATATVSVAAIDANRNTIAGVPVTISADANALVSVSGAVTGTNGTVTATVATGADKGDRLITVTATSGSISKSTTIQVVGTTINSVLVPAVIAPSTAGQVQYHVVDQAGNAMSGQSVQ